MGTVGLWRSDEEMVAHIRSTRGVFDTSTTVVAGKMQRPFFNAGLAHCILVIIVPLDNVDPFCISSIVATMLEIHTALLREWFCRFFFGAKYLY